METFDILGHQVAVIGFCAQETAKGFRILDAQSDNESVIEIPKEKGMFIHDGNLFQIIGN